MKRSQTIQLVLLGTIAGSALTGCRSGGENGDPPVSAENSYTNNHYVRGVGYYHAPYHGFFPYPYNSYAAGRGYFQGGQWSAQPGDNNLAASRPSAEAARSAQARQEVARANSSVRRSGFGSSSRSTAA